MECTTELKDLYEDRDGYDNWLRAFQDLQATSFFLFPNANKKVYLHS